MNLNYKKNIMILVCEQCGGTNIQTKAWVDANTLKFHDSISSDGDAEDNWCEDCEEQVKFITEEEFKL